MATGGIGSRSDALSDFTCTPCKDDGRNSEAKWQCVECQSYFCKKCVGHHNKVLRNHTLLDTVAMKSAQAKTSVQETTSTLPEIQCTDHPGNKIEIYCGQHDEVCCTVCLAVDHRSCKGVDYIPKLAKGIGNGLERQRPYTSLKKAKKKLKRYLRERKSALSRFDKEHDECINDIKVAKARLIDKVNELERKSIDLANTSHKHATDSIKSDISDIDDMLKMIDGQIDKIKKTSNDNETELFIHIQQSKHYEGKGNELLKEFEGKEDKSLTYEINTDIESILTDMRSLIDIKEDVKHADTAYSASLVDEFKIKVWPDKNAPSIYGCCSLGDNQILLTDNHNCKVKRLDSTLKVKDYIDISGSPYGICKTGDSEVAVSLRDAKKVQFISVGKQLTKNVSFNVGANCRGMCYSQGRLYICCAGGLDEDPGHVKVYDKSGKVLNVVQNDNSGESLFILPHDIYVNPQCSQMYIADNRNGILNINTKTNHSVPVTCTDIDDATGITTDERGNMFVCGNRSHTVIQMDRHGQVLGTILTQTDGINGPLCLKYLNNPSRLIVCEDDSDNIKSFKLS